MKRHKTNLLHLWDTFTRGTIQSTAGETWPLVTSPLKLTPPRLVPVSQHGLGIHYLLTNLVPVGLDVKYNDENGVTFIQGK